MSHGRPEHLGPPELFYDEKESRKYSSNSHIIKIQSELTQRAYDLLELLEDSGSVLLDIGCGSGLSGEVLTENGHEWIGVDISEYMLKVARDDNETSGDLILKDFGTGLPFRPGVFDGAISISAIQWLCHSNTNSQNPQKRLQCFFQSLYACMGRGARAVFQFYPESKDQCELITQQAIKAGFQGGLVIDFPDSPRLRKIYLVISAGGAPLTQMPRALHNSDESGARNEHVQNVGREVHVGGREMGGGKRTQKRPTKGSRAWIEAKRERQIAKGKTVKELSKYSGRRRR